ncbi:protein of unknown function DUF245 domain protein [Beutenbergia cavernae DSM 12333]|uniref:Proteasome accessory factor PafA2 n=1 Tax=Beutenbergia cavernae (strain ATCC BAA-8 / DSM 12333 / CCUG 43141 / JCM 11478 / NBRC 16432 / NCIMB 13614 / HKI 0122) TaxID=471853 RepID=C5BVA4_BEUC1|nr:protein of unknown function DUF245 domain protein [Beutenbergia cavernae DSM 12333]
MSVRRIMGIETEYGILGGDGVRQGPMALSAIVVAAYADRTRRAGRTRWSYEDEDPLRDARGWRLDRASAHPSQLTDRPAVAAPSGPNAVTHRRRPGDGEREDPAAANVILTNGARLYVDHAHPEYSSPEVTNPLDGVLWDRAGERVMLDAVRSLTTSPALPDVALYKNNVDGKGATYGTHENYLMDRSVPFGDVVRYLTPFLVTRQVFTGSGRVGIGPAGQVPGFQLSQRADYIEAEVGLETTLRRPIVNTRDEPHADPEKYRRLHVIVGDANCLEVATYLKLGTCALVLWMLETGRVPLAWEALALADPVAEFHAVSHDLTLTHRLTTADGRELTALEIQRVYSAGIAAAVADAARESGEATDEATLDVLARWSSLLARLDDDPSTCAREVEWLAKLRVLEAMRRRDHLAWDHPKLAALDLQWSDVRPERGIYARLRASGAVETLVTDDDVARAAVRPPSDTRAYFRGEVVRRYPDQVAAANWDCVILDVASESALRRVPMLEPERGTRAHVGALLDASPDAGALLAALLAPT